MLEAIPETFPDVKYQRCTVHFYRNVFTVVPRGKVREVSLMLKAIHAQENKEAARQKAKAVAQTLRDMKLQAAAKKVQESIDETLTYMEFPTQQLKSTIANQLFIFKPFECYSQQRLPLNPF